jgi:cysteine-rich repeat protein
LNVGEFCGNETVDTGETCDDGNGTNGDGCSATCQLEYCGDSAINNNGTEQCDDGNLASGDGCSATCQTEYCGDGSVNNGGTEQCDDGNSSDGDGCSATCVTEFCGDGSVNNMSEVCDGNTSSCSVGGYSGVQLCNATCDGWNACVPSEFCGDGVRNGTEACDDGGNTDCDGCRSDCTRTDHICGDGYMECGEICDSSLGVTAGFRCTNTCTLERNAYGVILPDFFTDVIISNVIKNTSIDSATILWTTNKAATCSFEWSESAETFTYTASEIERKRDHNVQVVDLDPGHTYFFTIFCQDNWGHKARTSVDSFATKPLNDKTPPSNVSAFKATPTNSNISLTWSNPKDSDLAGVKIIRSEKFYPKNPSDGISIYNDRGTRTVDKNVKAGKRYYYTAFSYDNNGNYSSGSITSGLIKIPSSSATTGKGGVKKPATNPVKNPVKNQPNIDQPGVKEAKPVDTTKKPETGKEAEPEEPVEIPQEEEVVVPEPKEGIVVKKIPFNASDYLVSLDSIKLDVVGDTINLFASTEFKMKISTSSLPYDSDSVMVFIKPRAGSGSAQESYYLRYEKESSAYVAQIISPANKGLYDMIISVLDKNKDFIAESKGMANVEEMGHVTSILNYRKNSKVFIKGAKITLYKFEDGDIYKWDATKYLQFNPAYSGSDGTFGFYVPNGKYLIKAEKDNFYKYTSLPLNVNNNLVNPEIEMIYIPQINIWAFILYIIALITLYFILRRLFIIVFKKKDDKGQPDLMVTKF